MIIASDIWKGGPFRETEQEEKQVRRGVARPH